MSRAKARARLTRSLRPLAWSIFCACVCVPVCAESDADLLSLWTRGYELRTGLGYRDNVLLSHFQPEGSAFWTGGAEFFLMRIPVDGTQISLLLSGDDRRYFSSPSVSHEDSAFATFDLKKEFANGWTPGLDLQYVYSDQVVDASISDTNRFALPLVAHAFVGTPFIRRQLPGNFFLELRPSVTRQLIQRPLDDYWQAAPKLVIGREFGNGSDATLAYEWRELGHDDRAALDANAFPIGGRSLVEQRNVIEGQLRYNWDSARRWRSATRAGYMQNRDNGGGFFDYNTYTVHQDLRYKAERYELTASARWQEYEYLVQTVDPNDPTRRKLTLLELNIRGEYRFAKSWKAFVDLGHFWSLSRQIFDDYSANSGMAGVIWEY